jgi:hypothetical protein
MNNRAISSSRVSNPILGERSRFDQGASNGIKRQIFQPFPQRQDLATRFLQWTIQVSNELKLTRQVSTCPHSTSAHDSDAHPKT